MNGRGEYFRRKQEVLRNAMRWEPFLKAVKKTLVCGYDFDSDAEESTCDRCGDPIQCISGRAHFYEERICIKCSLINRNP